MTFLRARFLSLFLLFLSPLWMLGLGGCSRCGEEKPKESIPTDDSDLNEQMVMTADYGSLKVNVILQMMEQIRPEKQRQLAYNLETMREFIDYQLGFLVSAEEAKERGFNAKLGLYGWPESNEREMYRTMYVQKILKQNFMDEFLTEEVIRGFYESHPEYYKTRIRRRGRFIRFDRTLGDSQTKLSMAHMVLADLNNGLISFEKAAETYSDDTESAKKGGDTGWINKPSDPKEQDAFTQIFFTASIDGGNYANTVYNTERNYYIVQIEGEERDLWIPFDKVSMKIRKSVVSQNFAEYVVKQGERLCEETGYRLHEFYKLETWEINDYPFKPDTAILSDDSGSVLDYKNAEEILGPMAEAGAPLHYSTELKQLADGYCYMAAAKRDGLYKIEYLLNSELQRIYRLSGALNREVLQGKIESREFDMNEAEVYYNAHKEDFTVIDEDTGIKRIPPYREVAVKASKANFSKVIDDFMNEWLFEELYVKHQVKIHEPVRDRLVALLQKKYHDPNMTEDEVVPISFMKTVQAPEMQPQVGGN